MALILYVRKRESSGLRHCLPVDNRRIERKEASAMLKRLQLFVLLLMALGVMAGCQAITGETAGQNIDDTTITTTVKAKLAADKGSSLTRVQVDTIRCLNACNLGVGTFNPEGECLAHLKSISVSFSRFYRLARGASSL